VQFVGRYFDDATVLRVAAAYERGTDWHKKHPSMG
jgi:aspartyl-tRNA(Asn)/glutamyl-tRNA(Gln) amidotransferase subunit A